MPRRRTTQEPDNIVEVEQQTPFEAVITGLNPERGILANAEVRVGGIMTIRNVKIKEDDYGLTVTMPRTKLPHTEQYKDAVFFADRSMKEQFDQAVGTAYHAYLQKHGYVEDTVEEPLGEAEEEALEQEDPGMSMGM